MRGKRVMLIVGSIIILIGSCILYKYYSDYRNIKIGEKALRAMYEFKDINELAQNTKALKSVTTEEVYNKLTVENADKALSVYLRLHKDPCKVQIIEAVPGAIRFTINAPTLAMGRTYTFYYDLNWKGKIKSSYEAELIPFPYDAPNIEIPVVDETDEVVEGAVD